MKALITGASSGIGEKIAYELSSRNYDLILVSQNIQKMKKVADNCKTEVDIIECDLRKKENVIKLYEKIKNENIEVFVNNAGFGLFGEFWETDLDRELEMIDVNIKAVHILTKLILTKFMKQNHGYILNVASSAGFMAGPKLSTYYATKNYVLRLSEAIYEELHRQKSNVKICILCPGPVNTNFNKTAGGKFNIKGQSSDFVAKYAIDKMFKNKLIIIPGIKIKLAIFFSRFVPTKLLLKITYNIQEKKNK